jgi:hypothetical protein
MRLKGGCERSLFSVTICEARIGLWPEIQRELATLESAINRSAIWTEECFEMVET